MRHATSDDLKNIEQLLEEIRKIKGITERQPGHFYYSGKNILHFHEDHGSLYVDIGEKRMNVAELSHCEIVKNVEFYISYIKSARNSKK